MPSTALVADLRGQRGFSLVEAVVATAMSVFAVIGLAYSFSLGRSLLARYEVARAALAVAQGRIEQFAVLPTAQIVPGTIDSVNFDFKGTTLGVTRWAVNWEDERFDSLGVADLDGNTQDLKRVTVTVKWGTGPTIDNVTTTRLFPAQ